MLGLTISSTVGKEHFRVIRINIEKYSNNSFHIYSVEWNAEHLTILVDNQVYFHFNNDHTGNDAWPFNNPMYLLLNVAVGGFWGGLKGVNSSLFPKKMEIDYVRVYQ